VAWRKKALSLLLMVMMRTPEWLIPSEWRWWPTISGGHVEEDGDDEPDARSAHGEVPGAWCERVFQVGPPLLRSDNDGEDPDASSASGKRAFVDGFSSKGNAVIARCSR
jgi:hypothetical protein